MKLWTLIGLFLSVNSYAVSSYNVYQMAPGSDIPYWGPLDLSKAGAATGWGTSFDLSSGTVELVPGAAQLPADWNASSGTARILNKPSIPSPQIQSDWNQASSSSVDFIKNKPTIPGVPVTSVFSRTGNILAALGDYTTALVSEDPSFLYFTNARAQAALAGLYEVPLTFSTGLTRSTNTITVNPVQNITRISGLTSNGFVITSGSNGSLSIDSNSYTPTSRSISVTSPITGGGDFTSNRTIGCQVASGSQAGCLASSDWSLFNGKVNTTRSIGTTSPLSGGGDLSSDRTISISQSTTSTSGYVSSTDWNTFNSKVGTTRSITATSPLTGGGDLSADRSISCQTASGTQAGCLSSASFTTFNSKEPAITATTSADYYRGDKTFQNFTTAARLTISATSPIIYNSTTGVISSTARSASFVSHSLNTAFQVSTTRDAQVKYVVGINATIALQAGDHFLETSPDNVTWTSADRFGITGLTLLQAVYGNVSAYVPAGYWVRIRTTGSAGMTYQLGQELLL